MVLINKEVGYKTEVDSGEIPGFEIMDKNDRAEIRCKSN